ncbi:MAG: nicotinamide-nucleotide adenylyltransferase, partial [Thermoplasmata archaeon]|nr:nicotinamide-nucleotide adenylyltransferase [Thermoplasmata archaeon]
KLAGYEVRSTALVDRELYSGTGIRELMIKGDAWRDLVPSSVGSYLDVIEGPSRVMDISGGGRS